MKYDPELLVVYWHLLYNTRGKRTIMAYISQSCLANRKYSIESGFTKPTGPVKPPLSGSGLPDRFDWKPVETG